ncbi:hypothetical protein MHBO_002826 [Bonamia ostreae]|uniref:Uncharacterized protein n=1 Tax=Bonamia ostreae TaxID=126728 RepID=A0ABV2ANQ1_9EUKA
MNWFKTSKAKVFVFSNSVFQILFNDKTEIIATSPCCLAEKKQKFSLCEKHCSAVSELERRFELYVEKVVVTFTKKNGDKETCLLSEATSSENNVLKQRALYLKEVVKKVTKTVPRLVLLERMRALDN